MTHRKIEEKIEVRYEDYSKLPQLIEGIKAAISGQEDIDTHLPLSVVLDSFHQRTLTLFVVAYTLETRYDKYLEVRQLLLLNVHREITRVGADVPLTAMTIYTAGPM